MAKINEINYIDNVSKQLNMPIEEFESYLLNKPYSDKRCGWYLMDIAQVLRHLPPAPARLLDLGVGSGWTSKIFAMSGYHVVGLDIASSMIKLAQMNCSQIANSEFHACDYEEAIAFGDFDCAVVYDALHHSINVKNVIKNVYDNLVKGGIFITVEPGRGHSQTEDTLEVVRKFGTTEKDMEFLYQKELMQEVGFSEIKQYYKLSELCLENVHQKRGSLKQIRQSMHLLSQMKKGATSVVVAIK